MGKKRKSKSKERTDAEGQAEDPAAKRCRIAGEVRGLALEVIDECAQLTSLALRLAATDEATLDARTVVRDALGATSAARGLLVALFQHAEFQVRDGREWMMVLPPKGGGVA